MTHGNLKMLNNIFSTQNISSRVQNFYNLLIPKLINQQSNSNPLEKIPQVIDSSIDQGVKKVGKIIGDSNELIRAPIKWLKEMQTSWLIFIICLTIICLCILLFYCIWQGYCVCKRSTNRRLNNNLEKLTMVMSKNANTNVDKY